MKTYLILSLLMASLFSCQQTKSYESLTADEFETLLLTQPEVQILDVRTLAEYSEGHIAGSININVLDKTFEPLSDSLLLREKPVALYCRSGKRSKKAADLLTHKGFTVYELDKGFNAWTEAKKPIAQ